MTKNEPIKSPTIMLSYILMIVLSLFLCVALIFTAVRLHKTTDMLVSQHEINQISISNVRDIAGQLQDMSENYWQLFEQYRDCQINLIRTNYTKGNFSDIIYDDKNKKFYLNGSITYYEEEMYWIDNITINGSVD
jgi:hypothetical protein